MGWNVGEKTFKFRGVECEYWHGLTEGDYYMLSFAPDGDFVDDNDDTYFIRCTYDENDVKNGAESPWYFERWYEDDCIEESFTDKESEIVKQLMTKHMMEFCQTQCMYMKMYKNMYRNAR